MVSLSPNLLGPPELNHGFKSLATSTTATTKPPMGLTENASPTFLSTGNPCLDFFFHIVPDTPSESIAQRLQVAWQHNPLTTLKLICHLRGVRGTGKSDKEGFYAAALWLHDHHPKTLASNARWFGEFGYLKDLPEILYRVLEGVDARKKAKDERDNCTISWRRGKRSESKEVSYGYKKGERVVLEKKYRSVFGKGGETRPTKPRRPTLEESILQKMKKLDVEEEEEVVAAEEEKDVKMNVEEKIVKERKKEKKEKKEEVINILTSRKKKASYMAKKGLSRYVEDLKYRFLHDCVCNLFAELLISDLKHLKSGNASKISLASKWCPSLDSSYDRATLICESIAKRVFPRDSDPEYEGIEEAHYAYRVRDRLRKQVLVPLRKALEIPELYMSSGDWNTLPYNRVASVAMKTYKKLFYSHDGKRFSEFLDKVEKGEAKIAAGALLPHEIIDSLDDDTDDDDNDDDEGSRIEKSRVGELQWQRMVEDLLKIGSFKNCIAVCDVSGSMEGTPMKVSVALGLLLSELSEEPWKGKLITFSESPELHEIAGSTLLEKKSFVKDRDWGMNTNFQQVFDKILEVAVCGKLSAEQMIKRVFVFSDMEFDQASANSWETDYEAIQRKFKEKGYGLVVPEIVFWNLRDSIATPVMGTKKGVALVSGYSKNLMKLFLEGDGAIDPEVVMEQAICGDEYKNLTVFD